MQAVATGAYKILKKPAIPAILHNHAQHIY